MNKYSLIRFNYPGLINFKLNEWIYFSESESEFAFLIEGFDKGLLLNDPNNSLVKNDQKKGKLKRAIENLDENGYFLSMNLVMDDDSRKESNNFSQIEIMPNKERAFFDYSYTKLTLLVPFQENITTQVLNEYLKRLITLYNLNRVSEHHVIPIPNLGRNWTRINYIQRGFIETEDYLEDIVIDKKPINVILVNQLLEVSFTTDFWVEHENSVENVDFISEKYRDIFELYSSAITHMNFYSNHKIALLESFIAVEILVSRVCSEIKLKKGVSQSKLNKYEKEISISYLMDVELPMYFDLSKKEIEIFSKVKGARAIRNKIMHKNQEFSDNEIFSHVLAIKNFLFLITDKMETVPQS